MKDLLFCSKRGCNLMTSIREKRIDCGGDVVMGIASKMRIISNPFKKEIEYQWFDSNIEDYVEFDLDLLVAS